MEKDKRVTKRGIIKAISKLIDGYRLDKLEHSPSACPLCNLYMNNGGKCRNCINIIFTGDSYYACINRTRNYFGLNWMYHCNNANLQNYWGEVLRLIKNSPAKEVLGDEFGFSPEFEEKLFEIANKYK